MVSKSTDTNRFEQIIALIIPETVNDFKRKRTEMLGEIMKIDADKQHKLTDVRAKSGLE